MQRYLAAVLTSNHRSSTPDPGATSLGSMAYLQCCGRGCWFQWAGRSEGVAPAGKRNMCWSPSVSATPNDARTTLARATQTEHARPDTSPQSCVLTSPASTPLGG